MTTDDIIPLLDTLPLKPFETPQSLISRIAAMNAAGSAREFCKDFLLDFDRITRGSADEITRLAALTGADAGQLMRAASVSPRRGHFALNGESLTSGRGRHSRLRACVDCMEEDMAAAPDLRGDAAVACRAYYLIDPIRTCPVHGRSFVQIADRSSLGEHRGDYSLALGDALDEIDGLKAGSVQREQSGFERYLMGRFGFSDRMEIQLLDPLNVTNLTKLCERIGVFQLLGRKGKLTDLDEHGWWDAGGKGFDVLAGGPEGVRGFVTAAYEAASDEQRSGLSNTIFGRFHYFLNSETAAISFLEIKQIIADRLSELLPYGPNDAPLFGVRFAKRYWHTLISAERQYGIPYRTIRQDVVAAGIADRVNLKFSKTRFIIDAEKLETLYSSGEALLSRRRVIYETGVQLHDIDAFGEAGLLHAATVGVRPSDAKFRQGAVTALVDTMLKRAEPLEREDPGMLPIREAIALTYWSRAEVMSMIANGRVRHGSVAGEKPLASLRVDLGHLHELHPLHGRKHITIEQAAAMVQVNEMMFTRLVQTDRIPWRRLRNPETGKQKIMLAHDDIVAFQASYIPVSEIWEKRGKPLRSVNPWLRSHGLEPAFPPGELHCTFYRRDEVERLLGAGTARSPPETAITERLRHQEGQAL